MGKAVSKSLYLVIFTGKDEFKTKINYYFMELGGLEAHNANDGYMPSDGLSFTM